MAFDRTEIEAGNRAAAGNTPTCAAAASRARRVDDRALGSTTLRIFTSAWSSNPHPEEDAMAPDRPARLNPLFGLARLLVGGRPVMAAGFRPGLLPERRQ